MDFEDKRNAKALHVGLGSTVKFSRSKSFPDKKGRFEDSRSGDNSSEMSPRLNLDLRRLKLASSNTESHSLLKKEILHLEKKLQDQFVERHTLEKALVCGSSYCDADKKPIAKPASELIKEIAVLEVEVTYLEQYLLKLYRKAFDQQTSVSPIINGDKQLESPVTNPRRLVRKLFSDEPAAADCCTPKTHSASKLPADASSNGLEVNAEETTFNCSVQRCKSALPHHSNYATRSSSPRNSSSKDLRLSHSQPLSAAEYAQASVSNIITLAEHLGTRISDHVPETPNRISEEMVRCMASVFCKLADPPSAHTGFLSPNSSSSSVGGFSPNYHCDTWSPRFGRDSSFDVNLDNPFNVEGLKEFSGPYSTMVEVSCIYRESQKLADVELLLENFRFLICRLQEIDPRKLKHDEKLAFWINVHNALVMHAFLAYGVPQNSVKAMFLLLKAAYNVGGRTISADTIQSAILGCRMSRPGQWLRMIISPKTKFKHGDFLRACAIERPEPLLHFALCSGNHSDPALRVYTPKRVLHELEGAKDEFIRATFGVGKGPKIVLPKLVELYAKDAGFSAAGIVQMIEKSVPSPLRKSLSRCQTGKSKKGIEWVPHNFSFRYLISKELVN